MIILALADYSAWPCGLVGDNHFTDGRSLNGNFSNSCATLYRHYCKPDDNSTDYLKLNFRLTRNVLHDKTVNACVARVISSYTFVVLMTNLLCRPVETRDIMLGLLAACVIIIILFNRTQSTVKIKASVNYN